MAIVVMGGCLLFSVAILHTVIQKGGMQYWLGGWQPPWGIEYRIDHLNGLMLVLVSGLGLFVAVSGQTSVRRELTRKTALFWSLFVLLITGLLGICITADLFNLFVLLEVASLAGYALIAMGEDQALFASFRYVVVGTLGASFYLLGVGHLYIATGSLNMADLAQLLPELYGSRIVLAGFAFILIGLSIKMALFPLHGWLPDAYTYSSSTATAIVAPLMTKVMAYVLVRVMFTVFKVEFSISVLKATDVLVWLGTLAIIFGAVMALSQNDFKRMLSYVIIAEIGFIVGGLGVANATAFTGAILHILNDAVMMASLFLVASLVMYKTNGHGIDNFKGLFKTMPVTAFIFTVGALAVIGVPPTGGFFSKWYLLLGAIEAHQWGFVVALLVCTLINIALFLKVFDKCLFAHANPNTSGGDRFAGTWWMPEAPAGMLFPAFMLVLAILLMGIFNQAIINKVILFTVPAGL